MFNNNKKSNSNKKSEKKASARRSDSNLSSVNMVSEGTEIIGTLNTKSDIRIAGSIQGEAKVNGKIIIASSGHIDGNIEASDADIAGRVEGEVHVSSKLTLRQSAVVEGDLFAQSLAVEEGATFNGSCHMREYNAKDKVSPAKNNKAEAPKKDDTVVA